MYHSQLVAKLMFCKYALCDQLYSANKIECLTLFYIISYCLDGGDVLKNRYNNKVESKDPDIKELDIDAVIMDCINTINDLVEVEWKTYAPTTAKDRERNVLYLPYPSYPQQIYQLFQVLFSEYPQVNFATVKDKPVGDLTEREIGGYFLALGNGERFCDGLIAGYIEDGRFLDLLIKLKEFRDDKRHRWKKCGICRWFRQARHNGKNN